MSQSDTIDDALIASYFEGLCTPAQKAFIEQQMLSNEQFRAHVAQLSFLLNEIPDNEGASVSMPPELTARALGLYDTLLAPPKLMDIAVAFVGNLLRPLTEGLQPHAMAAPSVRGEGAVEEDLLYHITLGEFSLSVELSGQYDREVELHIRPTQPVPPGWTIRLKEGEITRTASSLDSSGLQVESLHEGVYTVTLEHERENEHAFQLRLVTDDATS